MKSKGITLVALVVIIIILIIISGVTLNMLLGENGIITKTKIAAEENNKATATEAMNSKITNVQISTYVEKQRMPTLKELADNFCEDNDFDKVIEKTEVGSLTKISNENPTAIIAKLKAYPYEFEINSSLQLASIDGVKVATNTEDDTITLTKAQYKNITDRLEALENKTTMKNISKNISESISFKDSNTVSETELLSITITENGYADIYAKYDLPNNESVEYKGIYLYKNNECIAANGSAGKGGTVTLDISCTADLKAGDVVKMKGKQYTGNKTVTNGRISINYFPY